MGNKLGDSGRNCRAAVIGENEFISIFNFMNVLYRLKKLGRCLDMVFAFKRRKHIHIADDGSRLCFRFHIDNFLCDIISKFVYLSRGYRFGWMRTPFIMIYWLIRQADQCNCLTLQRHLQWVAWWSYPHQLFYKHPLATWTIPP